MISPHYDKYVNWKPSVDIPGYHLGWASRMVANCPLSGTAREGYIAALRALSCEQMPGAFLRDSSIADLQYTVDSIISALENIS
jgi:hypothetical protein